MKILIIEDEKRTAQRLETMLLQYDPTIEILAIIASCEDSVNWLKTNSSPDLIFMDIHLEDDQCFIIFDQLNLDIPVIFTTAYDEYMVKAFKVNSIDYLMKPVQYEDLQAAIDKFKRIYSKKAEPVNLQQLLQTIGVKEISYKDRFLVATGSRLRTIEIKNIHYFYSADKVTFLVTSANQHFPVDYSLDKLTSILDPKLYFRVNRHTIVRHAAIKNVLIFSKGRIKLELEPVSKVEVLVSIDRVTDFKEWMGR